MRGSGRTRLFKRLESALPGIFRDHTFAFFEDPFGALPHPLLWAHQERELEPTSRLIDCWKMLNEFNMKRLLPALRAHDVVVVDGYGLNGVLYATAVIGENREDDEAAISMHHGLVRLRVLEQGISPPEYFITRSDIDAMTDYLQREMPDLSVEKCHAFIRKEERIITDYFKPETGQVGVIFEPYRFLDEIFNSVVDMIGERLVERSANRVAA